MTTSISQTAQSLDELPEFLTAEDICKLLRISRTALCNASRLSNFPAPLRISKRALRWRKAEVEVYLNGQEVENG